MRIARDMHDVVAHSLAVVIAQADGARYAPRRRRIPAVATEALGTISTTARAALADVRLLLTQLRHSQGDGPQPTLADLEALYAQVRAAGVDLRVDVDPAPPGEPPAAVQLAVYRILQEALTNALRHGDGGPVAVRLALARRPASSSRCATRCRPAAAAAERRATGSSACASARSSPAGCARAPAPSATASSSCARRPADRGVLGVTAADPGRARRRPGAVPRRHPHARRLAARPRGRRRGGRRPRGGRGRARGAPRRRADGHPDAGDGRPRGDRRAAARRRSRPAS